MQSFTWILSERANNFTIIKNGHDNHPEVILCYKTLFYRQTYARRGGLPLHVGGVRVLSLSRQSGLPQRFTPTDSDTINHDDIILQDGIGVLDVTMPSPPHPVDSREQHGGADDHTAPVHVVDGRGCDRHIERAEVHDDDQHRPTNGNDVDQVAPTTEVEMRSRREDAASTDQDHDDWHHISDLQRHAAGRDDGLECEVAAEHDQACTRGTRMLEICVPIDRWRFAGNNRSGAYQ